MSETGLLQILFCPNSPGENPCFQSFKVCLCGSLRLRSFSFPTASNLFHSYEQHAYMLEIGSGSEEPNCLLFSGLEMKKKQINPFTSLVCGISFLRFPWKHVFEKESSHQGSRVQALLTGAWVPPLSLASSRVYHQQRIQPHWTYCSHLQKRTTGFIFSCLCEF